MKKLLCILLILVMTVGSAALTVEAANVEYAQSGATKDEVPVGNYVDLAETGVTTQSAAVSWVKTQADGNKALDYDGQYGAQCVDLIAYYLQYLGMTSLIGGNAKDYINKTMPSGSGWVKYTYSSGFTPKPGDICVWGANATLDADGYWTASSLGHIGIVYSVGSSTFTSVEQNVNGKQYCQYISNRSISKVNTYIRPFLTIDLGTNFYANIHTTAKSGFSVAANDSANVYLDTTTYSDYQKWYFERQSDTSYKITNVKLSKCLDVYGAKTDNGTNIQVYKSNDSNAQRFYIVTNESGYSLVPKCSTTSAVDVTSANFAKGTNIEEWKSKLNAAQRFTISKTVNHKDIGTNFYANIKSINSGFSVAADSSSNVVLATASGTNNYQKWLFERQSDKTYKIKNVMLGKYLDVYGAKTANKTNVQVYSSNNSSAQRWYVVANGSYYRLVPKCSLSSALDINGGTFAAGTNIQEYTQNSSNAQKFSIVSTNLNTPSVTKTENTTTGVKLTWGKVTGAAKYRVFIKSGSSWKKLGDTTALTYTHTAAKSGTKYTYTVRCITSDGSSYTSAYNTTGWSRTFIAAPQISKLQNTSKGVKITWGKVTGAAKYRVYVKSGSSGYKKLTDTASTTYTHTAAKSGTTYTYTVRCVTSDGKTLTSSYYASGKSITCKR